MSTMRRLLIAILALLLTAGLAACGSRPEYTVAGLTISGGMISAPTSALEHWQVEDGMVTTVSQVNGDRTTDSYPLADPEAFQEALHAALNPPDQEPCPDASAVTIQAEDSTGATYNVGLVYCGKHAEVVDELRAQLSKAE